MATPDYVFNSEAEWATGEFSHCNAVDPAGKLTPGVSPEILAAGVSENNLSVYLRCREGSGTVIENVGSAGDGTLSGGVWATRDDGRHYISGGTVTVPYGSSMRVAKKDDNGNETSSYDWTAQIRVRFSSLSSVIFMQRANRFRLGMDSDGYPYVENYYHISRVYRAKATFESDSPLKSGDWFSLGNSNVVEGSVSITMGDGSALSRTYEVDYTYGKIRFTSGGDFVGSVLVDYMHHEATGWNKLTGGKVMDVSKWHTVAASCNGGSLSLYVDGKQVASLSSDYADNDPGTDLVAGFPGDWDSVMYSGGTAASNRVSFPSSGSWTKKIALGGDFAVQYVEAEAAIGREHSISVSFSFADDEDDLPYVERWSYSKFVDGFNKFYPPESGLYHGTHMMISVSLSEGDYDRDAVLLNYLKIYLREPAPPLGEQVASPYEDLHVEDVTAEDLGALIRDVKQNREVIKRVYRTVTTLHERVSKNYGGGGFGGDPGGGGNPGGGASGVAELRAMLEEHINADSCVHGVSQGAVAGIIDIEEMIGYHNSRFVNVHGIGDTRLLLDITHNVSTGVHGLYSSAHVASEEYVEAAINSGLEDGGEIDSAVDALIAAHAASSIGLHGAPEGKPIAYASEGDGDVLTTAAGFITAGLQDGGMIDEAIDSLIANHAGLRSDVHGAGSGYVAISSQHSETVDHLIEDHAGLKTGVHGADGGQYVAISSQDYETVEDLISDHDGSSSAHSNMGWQDSTQVHDIAADEADYAVTGHQNRCSNYAL